MTQSERDLRAVLLKSMRMNGDEMKYRRDIREAREQQCRPQEKLLYPQQTARVAE